jgi:hypothetical protein
MTSRSGESNPLAIGGCQRVKNSTQNGYENVKKVEETGAGSSWCWNFQTV